MSKKKYLRKNEFKYDRSPSVTRHDGKGHVVYVSAKHGHKAKINVITHSEKFFDEPTKQLGKNPNRESKDSRQSRFSVPRWESDTYLESPKSGFWKFTKKDRKTVKKFNKHYKK